MGKKIQRICIIAGSYPTETEPDIPFVEQLVVAFTENGLKCTVISPVSISNGLIYKKKLRPMIMKQITSSGTIDIYSPRYVTFSSLKRGAINTNYLNLCWFQRACFGILTKIGHDFDAVYGHFIPSGITANMIARAYNIPAFFAYGENTDYTIDYFGAEKIRTFLDGIAGVVAVSSANKEKLIVQNIVEEDKIGVFPNCVNKKLFYKRDKSEMRRKYGLPEHEFIVAFVGRFVEIKGANRLSEAIELVGPDKVKSLFIGSGKVGPHCGGILLKGKQPHVNIPELLSAADIFALPTLAEGCCNAIIEAMACGLPVVSSIGSFNDDILDESCSIRVDPTDIHAIAVAISTLYEDEKLRNELAEGALRKSEAMDLNTRARNIIAFMEPKKISNLGSHGIIKV